MPASPANTGDGGGGGGIEQISGVLYTQNGGNGGSGIVIVSAPNTDTTVSATGSFTETAVGSNNVFIFTGNGSITF